MLALAGVNLFQSIEESSYDDRNWIMGVKPVNTDNVKRLAEVHESGMEPDVIAARVLEAMREDRFHVFTHPEFKDELSEVFGAIPAGLP